MPGAYTPWEDVSAQDSEVVRKIRINTLDNANHSIEEHVAQDCTEVLEMNAALRNRDNFSGSLWAGRSWVQVAQIPFAVLEKWMIEEDIDFYRWNDEDKARIVRRLISNEWSGLRTAPGRI